MPRHHRPFSRDAGAGARIASSPRRRDRARAPQLRGAARAVGGASPRGRARRGPGRRQAARQGQPHRARARGEAARPRHLRGARRLRTPSHDRFRDGPQHPRRRRDHRTRHDRRAAGVRLQPGLHRLRRLARGGHEQEDLQADGPRRARRLPPDRHQRLRRRPHPGGRRLARGVRRRLLPQRPLLWRDPADLADHGAVRGRGRLLARDHRFHPDGEGNLAHVHHRPRRDQDRHRRDGCEELGGAITHNTRSGVAHFATEDEDHCLEEARYLLSFLPQNNLSATPPVVPADDPERMDPELDAVVPDNPREPSTCARRSA